MTQTAIHWFRRDLRLADNPALTAAAAHGTVVPVFILEDDADTPLGGASKVWLHHALDALNRDLGGKLVLCRGAALDILPALAQRVGADLVTWTRRYDPGGIARDTKVKAALQDADISVQSVNGSLLWEPWEIKTGKGTPYRVFTPFYQKGCLAAAPPRQPLAAPNLDVAGGDAPGVDLPALGLLPQKDWHISVAAHWRMDEAGGQEQLDDFAQARVDDYDQGRNFPDRNAVSRLSPYLHFGQVSPNQAWHRVQPDADGRGASVFRSELGWREFSWHLLYHFPDLPEVNLQRRFDGFAWRGDAGDLRAWQRGQTGIPMVDAGMRELWQTGYMHNRVRMIVASFLAKNLRIDWRQGAAWFWDCLFDADLANNSASWQWVAGSGADAAPYFRIFNPVTQAEKFDPDGAYIRRYVPEIAELSGKALFAPWTAKPETLKAAGVRLGDTYPAPIVDLGQSRKAALAAYQDLPKDAP